MPVSVGIHPPKTPVTSGSGAVAKNTLPNVCKMPGPPAPFVPSPLPNVAKSELSPKGYSTTVKIDGNTVAIRGATFESIGDIASKGTGGGLISANTHGPAKFITPGSMTVKIEGKSVHLLGEPMLNNCGPSGTPPNTGATMMGVKNPSSKKHTCPPHLNLVEEVGDVDKAAAKNRSERDKQEKAKEKFENEKAAATTQAEQDAAQMKIDQCTSEISGLDDQWPGLEWEKKVADDLKAANPGKPVKTQVKIRCKDCRKIVAEFDAVTPTEAKESKHSAGAYRRKKEKAVAKGKPPQHRVQKLYAETRQVFGPGVKVKVAVPAADVDTALAENPELTRDRMQGH